MKRLTHLRKEEIPALVCMKRGSLEFPLWDDFQVLWKLITVGFIFWVNAFPFQGSAIILLISFPILWGESWTVLESLAQWYFQPGYWPWALKSTPRGRMRASPDLLHTSSSHCRQEGTSKRQEVKKEGPLHIEVNQVCNYGSVS